MQGRCSYPVDLHTMNNAQILSAINEQISRLEQARTLLLKEVSALPSTAAPEAKRRGRPPGGAKSSDGKAAPEKSTRGMSEEGRARIAAAQKARWAAKKKGNKQASKAAAPAAIARKAAKPAKQLPGNKSPAVKAPAPSKAAPATLTSTKAAPVKSPAKKKPSAGNKKPTPASPEPVESQVERGATSAAPAAVEAPAAE